jgi:hypothetical protein
MNNNSIYQQSKRALSAPPVDLAKVVLQRMDLKSPLTVQGPRQGSVVPFEHQQVINENSFIKDDPPLQPQQQQQYNTFHRQQLPSKQYQSYRHGPPPSATLNPQRHTYQRSQTPLIGNQGIMNGQVYHHNGIPCCHHMHHQNEQPLLPIEQEQYIDNPYNNRGILKNGYISQQKQVMDPNNITMIRSYSDAQSPPPPPLHHHHHHHNHPHLHHNHQFVDSNGYETDSALTNSYYTRHRSLNQQPGKKYSSPNLKL